MERRPLRNRLDTAKARIGHAIVGAAETVDGALDVFGTDDEFIPGIEDTQEIDMSGLLTEVHIVRGEE